MPRKRTHDEMEGSEPPHEKQTLSLLQRIRNMWEFASVMQFIFMFGKAVKIDEDFDIEDFENECLKPGYSERLEEIGLTLLKWISSHRGLNRDIWDEYTRRQYLSKAPHLNPYGDDEEPKRFREFSIFQKIRVLHQLTVWAFWNPDKIRERMPEHQREIDQLEWRVEELGYDREDRQYYLLDDNRLYRRGEPPLPDLPVWKPKANTKKAQAARRRARRRVIEDSETPELEDEPIEKGEDEKPHTNGTSESAELDTFGGYTWECVSISLNDYNDFCESLKKSRDPNEKILRQRIIDEVIGTIEAAEEKHRRKIERREKELLVMERMAGAKRSSRIAGKLEQEKREHEVAEADRKRAADLAAAHREKERQDQMELDRQYRMMTREQRIKDREYKRLLVEEELARTEAEHQKIAEGQARGSERQLKDRMERNKKDLESLNAEEEWSFDCSGCGVHGKNLDDGSHSVACEKCNVWQHSKCLGIDQATAEKDDFQFVCRDCRRKSEEAKKPKISLKFKVGPASPPTPTIIPGASMQSPEMVKPINFEGSKGFSKPPSSQGSMTNGYHLTKASPGLNPALSSLNAGEDQNGYQPFVYYQPNQSPGRKGYVNQSPSYGPQPISSMGHPHTIKSGMTPSTAGVSVPRPGSSDQNYPSSSYSFTPSQRQLQTPLHYAQHSQFYNGPPPQYPTYSVTPRPLSSHGHSNGQSPLVQTRPSPVLNRPIISPTQGNHDVGPIAGIPQSTPLPTHQHSSSTPTLNGTPEDKIIPQGSFSQHQQTPLHAESGSFTSSSTPRTMSGLSPTKHPSTSPLPPPSNVPIKMSMSPSAPPAPSVRSVSGTPILPPVETLAPSAEQLQKTPMPTPSKQPTSAELGHEELRRISAEVERSMSDVQQNGRS